jgi:class 3 adenylate cyclase
MPTTEQAAEHFATLVREETTRQLEKTKLAARDTQSLFIKNNSVGSRMYLEYAKHHENGLVALREFIGTNAEARLRPFTEHASPDALAALRDAVVQTFDEAAARFETSLRGYIVSSPANAALRRDVPPGVLDILDQAKQGERRALLAELALSISRPERSAAPSRRRLTAVLFIDVVGSTRLMAANSDETARALSELQEQCRETAGRNGGRYIKSTGDGSLTEYSSAHGAMQAAIEIFAAARQIRHPASQMGIELRAGLTTGDVHEQDEDILGNAVNLAARLQDEASTGAMCVPRHLRDELETAFGLPFQSLGPRTLRNIPHEVEAFQVDLVDPGPRQSPHAP